MNRNAAGYSALGKYPLPLPPPKPKTSHQRYLVYHEKGNWISCRKLESKILAQVSVSLTQPKHPQNDQQWV